MGLAADLIVTRGGRLRLDSLLLACAAILIALGTFLASIAAGFIVTGILLATLTVLYVYEPKVNDGIR